MNIIVTSKEEILNHSREIVKTSGIESINMRSVALACDVAVGSIYNYFPSKSDLISAIVESIWIDIFHFSDVNLENMNFTDVINWFYKSLINGNLAYPNFLSFHSHGFDNKVLGKNIMNEHFNHIKLFFMKVLENDINIKENVFSYFSKEEFISFIFNTVISIVVNKNTDIHVLNEIVKRTIY